MPEAPSAREMIERIRRLIREKDPRYPLAAYQFIYEALDETVRSVGERRHVTGRELLDGIRRTALKRFGPLAKMVFNHWNIRETADFGNLVFNLVEYGLMSRTEEDTPADFAGVFDFDDAFLRAPLEEGGT